MIILLLLTLWCLVNSIGLWYLRPRVLAHAKRRYPLPVPGSDIGPTQSYDICLELHGPDGVVEVHTSTTGPVPQHYAHAGIIYVFDRLIHDRYHYQVQQPGVEQESRV